MNAQQNDRGLMAIADVKPPVWNRSWSNPASQGSLVAQTKNWPKKYVPKGYRLGSIYIDRVWFDEPYNRFICQLQGRGRGKDIGPQQSGVATLFERASDVDRIKACSWLFEQEVMAARCVYSFNVSNGNPCEQLQAIYRDADVPKRIQRKRAKGWRMPEGVVSVTRPGKWGNPFDTAEEFRRWLDVAFETPMDPETAYDPRLRAIHRIRRDIEQLRGKDLACWCKWTDECHADVLIELANRPMERPND